MNQPNQHRKGVAECLVTVISMASLESGVFPTSKRDRFFTHDI